MINTVMCPHCDARVNHVVLLGGDGKSIDFASQLVCPRCKQPFDVGFGMISTRVKDDASALSEFSKQMEDADGAFQRAVEDVSENVVDDALDRADSVFSAARHSLDDIRLEGAADVIDADVLLDKFSVPDVKTYVTGKASASVERFARKHGASDATVRVAQEVVDAVYDETAERVREKVASNTRR